MSHETCKGFASNSSRRGGRQPGSEGTLISNPQTSENPDSGAICVRADTLWSALPMSPQAGETPTISPLHGSLSPELSL